MKSRYEPTSARPSTSLLPHLRSQSHGKAAGSLFGTSRPVGRRTPTKRIPRCCLWKPSLNMEALEPLDSDDALPADESVSHRKSSKYRGITK
jgi:hypothetical protein